MCIMSMKLVTEVSFGISSFYNVDNSEIDLWPRPLISLCIQCNALASYTYNYLYVIILFTSTLWCSCECCYYIPLLFELYNYYFVCRGIFAKCCFLFHSIYLQLKISLHTVHWVHLFLAMNSISISITYAFNYYTIFFILSLIKLDFDYVTIYSDSLKYLVSL